jgi:hypothetical protein
MTLALMALALLAALRLATAFLIRRRLAAWETAWSRVGTAVVQGQALTAFILHGHWWPGRDNG